MAKKKQQAECAYCGELRNVTREHVVPKCLFIQPLPSNPIIVPVCEKCNNAKSTNDSFLRDLLVVDPFAENHPIARKIMQTKMMRSAENNRSEVARRILTQGQKSPFYSHGGIYLGEVYSAELEKGKVEQVFFSICKGLLFDAQNLRIPDEYETEVIRFQPREFAFCVEEFSSKASLKGPRIIGDVFWATYLQVQEDPCSCIFLLSFYGGVGLSITIMRSDLAKKYRDGLKHHPLKNFGAK